MKAFFLMSLCFCICASQKFIVSCTKRTQKYICPTTLGYVHITELNRRLGVWTVKMFQGSINCTHIAQRPR